MHKSCNVSSDKAPLSLGQYNPLSVEQLCAQPQAKLCACAVLYAPALCPASLLMHSIVMLAFLSCFCAGGQDKL